MNNQVNKKYIRNQFEQINRETELDHSSSQIHMQSPLLIITSKDAEDYLTVRNGGIKVRMIRFMFRHKETMKRIPIIGKILVNKKNQMIRTKMSTEMENVNLQLDTILRLNFDDFIRQAYNTLFGRNADPQGILEYRQHKYNGASNEAIAYLLIMSAEFNNRYNVIDINKYKKKYRKYLMRKAWYKIPVIGKLSQINTLSNNMKALSDQIDYVNNKLDESMQKIENNNIERNYNLIEVLKKLSLDINKVDSIVANTNTTVANMTDEITENLTKKLTENLTENLADIYSDQISDIHKDISSIRNQLNEQLTIMSNDNKTNIYIGTAISEKIDLLPNLITQNNLKNKSMITSLPGGVTAVHAGEFIMGIPSEEWGLAMYLSLHGHFEPGSEKLFCNLLREGMTVIDVGANLGIYTLHALRAGCKVYSYEPTPSTYDLLNQNIKVNGFLESNRATTINCAVGDSDKTVTFSICKGISGHNHIASEEDVDNIIKVPVVSLDNRHKSEKIDFIKIDIEGAEYEALKGMRDIIKNNPDIMLLIEFAPSLIKRAGNEPKDLLKLIYEYGLIIQKIDENTSQLCDIDENELLDEISVNLLLSFHKR